MKLIVCRFIICRFNECQELFSYDEDNTRKTHETPAVSGEAHQADSGRERLSQEGLADIAELHRTYVSSVERGERNVTVDSLERLADALGVDIRAFFEPE